MKLLGRSFVLLLAFGFAASGKASYSQSQALTPVVVADSELQTALIDFHKDPQKFLDTIPAKKSLTAEPGEETSENFGAEGIRSKAYIDAKAKLREKILKNPERLESFSDGGSNFSGLDAFLEGHSSVTSLREMERLGFESGVASEGIWSGYSWPTYRGLLGQRYADRRFPGSGDWSTNYRYARSQDPFDESDDRILSPSEKYDVLTDDHSGRLTRAMWNEGRKFYDSSGYVEHWYGICHGWSVASPLVARPSHSITAYSASGRPVTFNPTDIKALVGLLWAYGSFPYNMIGGRCNVKNPARDSVGRLIQPECQDINPGVWHIALTNRLHGGTTFVFDSTYDYEIWNQVIVSYRYTYFNPQSLQPSSRMSDAAVSVRDFSRDKFYRYRSPRARTIVGVALDLVYLGGTFPSTRDVEGPERDTAKQVRYVYDLELDDSGRIIGGEWYNNSHPDFIWAANTGTRARSAGDDRASGSWSSGARLPNEWRGAAATAADRAQPLAAIVEELVRRSH